jgi:hypothetical protein
MSAAIGQEKNDRTLAGGRLRLAWPARARTAVALIAPAGPALLAAACRGSPGSHVTRLGPAPVASCICGFADLVARSAMGTVESP